MYVAWLLLMAIMAVQCVQQQGQYEVNKFKASHRADIPEVAQEIHEGASEAHSSCNLGMRIAWKQMLGSVSLSGASVADFDNDGKSEIVVATAARYVEALDAESGARCAGWPFAFRHAQFLSSPLLYDLDDDGHLDVLTITESAQVVALSTQGYPLFNYTMVVPPLPLKKNWFGDGPPEALSQSHTALWRQHKAPRKFSIAHKMKATLPEDPGDHVDPKEEQLLTDAGLRSFDIFLRTAVPYNYVSATGKHMDIMFSPTYRMPEYDEHSELLVPPHVAATPVIADLDRDGLDELIVPVSYYFDAEDETDDEHPVDRKRKAYLACSIAVFDLRSRQLQWVSELDLTFDAGPHRAYIFASPTVVDLTGDGNLEIIVGTGSGEVHVLDHNGHVVDPFPAEMDAIGAQLVVEDFTNDGVPEIVALDRKGNLVCYDNRGGEQWVHKLHLGNEDDRPADNSPTVGDINGDGDLDLLIGTQAGVLYAINARTGVSLPGFPLLFPHPIDTEVALSKKPTPMSNGMHLWVCSGHRVYVVDGSNPQCLDFIDVGAPASAPIILGEFTLNSRLDAVYSAASGAIFCIETDLPYHATQHWSTPWNGGGMLVSRSVHGIHVENREWRDVVGDSFPVRFQIVDRLRKVAQYNVSIFLNGEKVYSRVYDRQGSFVARIPALKYQTSGTIVIQMEDDRHQMFYDYFTVAFQQGFSRLLKWVLVLPLIVLCAVVAYTLQDQQALPQ